MPIFHYVRRMTDDERQELGDQIMQADLQLKRTQQRWEVWKALAMILLAAAAIAASARLADWVYPPRPQTITVHLDGPLVVTPPPAR